MVIIEMISIHAFLDNKQNFVFSKEKQLMQ